MGLTLEQQRAIALAEASLKVQDEDNSPEVQTPPEKRNYALSEVPGSAVANLVPDMVQTASGVVDLAKSIGGTVGRTALSAFNVATGRGTSEDKTRVNHLYQLTYGTPSDDDKKMALDVIKGIGSHIKSYTNYEGLKRNVAEHPFGTALDLSMVGEGLGGVANALKIPGAQRLIRGSELINPVTPIVKGLSKVGEGVGGVANYGYNLFSPKSNVYLNAAEGQGNALINALRNPEINVPGSMPIAAQAATDVNATKFQALGESSSKILPSEYLMRKGEQKTAIINYLGKVSKTPEELYAAESLRGDTAKDLYGKANESDVIIDKTLKKLMDRPAMGKAISRAKEIAANENVPFTISDEVSPVIMRNKMGIPIKQPITQSEVRFPVNNLHIVKKALDDMISNPDAFGIGRIEAASVGKVRKELIDWIEENSPIYKEARETFASQSEPINQIQVGQYLQKKLSPALGEDTARLGANAYSKALEEAPTTIRKATTGVYPYKNLSSILDPDQMQIVNSIKEEFIRNAKSEEMTAAARKSMSGELESGLKEHGAPTLLNAAATIANNIYKRLAGAVNKETAIQIATEMLNPGTAAKGLEDAMAFQRKGEKIAKPFKKSGNALNRLIQARGIPQSSNALRRFNNEDNEVQ